MAVHTISGTLPLYTAMRKALGAHVYITDEIVRDVLHSLEVQGYKVVKQEDRVWPAKNMTGYSRLHVPLVLKKRLKLPPRQCPKVGIRLTP